MQRVAVLDPLRGIASLAVMWFHLAHASSYMSPELLLDKSGVYGKLGVQVFFVISGFVLPYALLARDYRLADYGRFVAKRVVRLDPPYFVTILGVLLLGFASTFVPGWKGSFEVTFPAILGHFAYVNAFLGFPWLVPVFWTLAIEFQFYLIVALLYPLLVQKNLAMRMATLACLCSLSFFFTSEGPTSYKPYVFQHIYLFALGIAAFWYHCKFVGMRTFTILLGFGALGAAITLGLEEAIAAASTAIVIVFLPGLSGGKVLAYFGSISYSLYLVHLPIGDRVLGIAERIPAIPKPVGLLLGCAVSIIAADVLYRLVERPSQRLSSMISYRRLRRPKADHGSMATDADVLGVPSRPVKGASE